MYVAECVDGSYYTGIAKDITRRIETHNAGKGSKYTATHRPVKLVFQEPQADYSAALRREYQIKSLSKVRKVRFVSGETLPKPPKKAKMSFQRRRSKADPKPRRHKGKNPKNSKRTGKIKNHGPMGISQ
ncbi:MAG TPA: GIY-YIG nuclease family protein [bacterium]|nr:GIY-YIG nuclease family protein [bacterium]